MSIIKPPYWSTVDLSHPHANGLVVCCNMNDIGNVCTDMLRNKNDIALTNTSWVADGLEANANGEYGLLNNTGNNVINSEAGTVIVYVRSYQPIDDGGYHGLISNNVTGGMYLMKWGNGQLRFNTHDTVSSHYISINPSKVPNWTTGTQIAILWDRSAVIHDSVNLAINIDGDHADIASSLNATSWIQHTKASSIGVLNDLVTKTYDLEGVAKYAYIYNKVLTEAELKDIYENPYAMMKSKASIISVFFPTLIGGNPWYYNAQQI